MLLDIPEICRYCGGVVRLVPARAVYGDASKWTKIYEANKSVIGKNPNLIYPGQKYTIPN